MEATVFGSIFFVVAFAILFLGVFRYKKSNYKLNGVSWLMISLIAILCYGAMMMGLLNIVYVPINIISTGIVYLLTGILLHLQIKKENKEQEYRWERYDFLYLGILFIIMFLLGGKYFGSEINLTYLNSDAAVHFKNAMSVVRMERMENVYFAPFHTAMIIETVMPFVAEVNLFKVFIVTDVAKFLLEIAFFVVVVRDYMTTKSMKVIGFIVAILYMSGYPLNSFLYSFYYWGMGVMLIAFLLLMLRYYANHEIDRRISLLGMMLGCAALPITYMIFGPIMYIAIFIMLVVIKRREGKIISLENVCLALKIFLLPTCMAIYYCLFNFLIPMNATVGGVLKIRGGIYEGFYINFMWTLPFVIYMHIKTIREKKINETMVSLIVFGFVATLMCVMILLGRIESSYYFYKLYYPLWLFFFILTVQAIEDLWSRTKDILIPIFVLFGFMAFMYLGNVETKIATPGGLLNTTYLYTDRACKIFEIWDFNKNLWNLRELRYPDEYLDICNYVIEELENEEKEVPLLVTEANYANCYWYEGITGEPCSNFYGWFYSMDEIKEKITRGDVNYFVVYKNTYIYDANADYFNEFEHVFENELGFVAKVK